MASINNIRMKPKLIGGFLIAGLVPIFVIITISISQSRDALINSYTEKLEAVQSLKEIQLINVMANAEEDLTVLRESGDVASLYQKLLQYHIDTGVTATGSYNVETESYKDITTGGEDLRLDLFRKEKDYYDIFLVCTKHGHVMWSSERESDLGQNISSGPLKDSGLGRLWKKVKDNDGIAMEDFSPYAPSNNEVTIFMGDVLKVEGSTVGMIAVQFKSDFLTNIMNTRAGMGESGETYVVGIDKRMRSNSYLEPATHSVQASFDGTIEENGVDTESVRDAIRGMEGTKFTLNYSGNKVLSVYKPLTFHDIRWIIVSEINEREIMEPVNRLIAVVIIIGIIIAIVVIFLGLFLAMNIVKPLIAGVLYTQKISNGDLTEELKVDQKDEVGQLLSALHNMTTKIKEIVGLVYKSSLEVSNGSQELQKSSQSLSNGANNQASSVEEVSSSMEEMVSNIKRNAENAQGTDKIARESSIKAENGGQAVLQSVEAMKEIASKINIVQEIANRTNLLALNASIEAARAGEYGKGFAVVASEVAKLAERSKESAAEISALSRESVIIAEGAGKSIMELLPEIQKTAELIQEINASSSEQNSGADQINMAIGQLDKVIQSNAAAAEESAAMSETLYSQSQELRKAINFFKI